MTAGVVLERMEGREFIAYVSGVVEGIAYARYKQDSQNGQPNAHGMTCIYDWFYRDDRLIFSIQKAFAKYPDHFPGTIISVMAERECRN